METLKKLIQNLYRFIFSHHFFFKFNSFIHKLSIIGIGINEDENSFVNGEKYFKSNYIKPLILNSSNFILFDVGSFQGDYIKDLNKLSKNLEIFCFEPDILSFTNLKNKYSGTKGINIYNTAISSSIRESKLYSYNSMDNRSHSSMNKNVFSNYFKKNYVANTVHTTTIDEFCKLNNVNNIDLLKIDVEGHELEVLKGANEMISKNKISKIQFEFTQLNVEQRIFFKDFWDFLKQYDYTIYRLLPKSMLEIKKYDPQICELFCFQNYIAINKTF